MKTKIAIFAFVILCAACTVDDKDETDPVFQSLTLNAETFEPNDVLELSVGISDNENLNQVRVRISTSFAKTFGDWKDLEVRDISGTNYQGTFSFVIPDTARAGYYQISTQAADLRGNGTKDSIMYFTILQPGFAPELTNFQTSPPIVSNIIYMMGQDSLRFFGTVSDDGYLDQITIDLRSTTNQRIQLLTYNVKSDSISTFDLTLNADTILPQYDTRFPGSLLIKVLDWDGNQTRMEVPIEFAP